MSPRPPRLGNGQHRQEPVGEGPAEQVGGAAIRHQRSRTAPLRSRPLDREDRRPPRVGSTVRPRRSSSAQSPPFGSSARLRRSHARPRTRRTEPRARATGGSRTRRDRPTWCRTQWQSVSRSATTQQQFGPMTALPVGVARPCLVRRVRPDCSERRETCLPSASAISSMTSFNTENRSARTTASAPCKALRLSSATTAAPPIAAASFRADSLSALESWRASPPAASWRAMADPMPPVPMIAVVMIDSSAPSRSSLRRARWPLIGEPISPRVRRLSHFDQMTIGITDVAADFVLVLLRWRQEFSHRARSIRCTQRACPSLVY